MSDELTDLGTTPAAAANEVSERAVLWNLLKEQTRKVQQWRRRADASFNQSLCAAVADLSTSSALRALVTAALGHCDEDVVSQVQDTIQVINATRERAELLEVELATLQASAAAEAAAANAATAEMRESKMAWLYEADKYEMFSKYVGKVSATEQGSRCWRCLLCGWVGTGLGDERVAWQGLARHLAEGNHDGPTLQDEIKRLTAENVMLGMRLATLRAAANREIEAAEADARRARGPYQPGDRVRVGAHMGVVVERPPRVSVQLDDSGCVTDYALADVDPVEYLHGEDEQPVFLAPGEAVGDLAAAGHTLWCATDDDTGPCDCRPDDSTETTNERGARW